ncbi:excinuclease ABC subunit C [Mesoplasma lactucae ATCC 49193]|nr:excinuclease ABC subunit UvrC [Mesoplasma lactucae]ATZ20299.1 excinuclease ABC subunit C [Mesoplasma lactucae ATCC 49193]
MSGNMKTSYNSPELEAKVKNLPHKPGCYIYYNKEGKVIYVGKAKDLRKRVTSYFNRVQNIKTTRLVRDIADLRFFVVNNEAESFLLESNLIKKYRPRYNILLNDDKSYPYITITNEKDTQYRYVRKYDKRALRNYGPFPQGSNARSILRILERLFPLRRCKGNLGKPCIHYHIDQCSGACFKDVPREYYMEQIKHIDKFFKGNTKEVEENLKKKMYNASDNQQYEEAGRIKELLLSLDYALSKQEVTIDDDKNRDAIAYKLDDEKIVFVTLFYRSGHLLYKDESVHNYYGQDVEELVGNYINQIYQKNVLPDQIIVPDSIDLYQLEDKLKPIATHPITNKEISLYHLAEENAEEGLHQAHLKAQTVNNNEEKVLQDLQNLLHLPTFPQDIEMFDISNLGNDFVTGSCVVYKGGKPDRNSFRKYNIEIDEQDDASRLKNMLYRRYQKALVEERELPDLIIMDGGMNQVHAAKEILSSLDLDIPVIGLVKNNHHNTEKILDLNEQEVSLDKRSPIYNLLANIQTRVDTYAKSGFRQKQNRSFLTNELEHIKGLGKKKIQDLNKTYQTIGDMKKASYEELNQVVKNKETTKNLYNHLHNEDLENK